MAVIYRITNMANGKYYIGSADSFARREWQHKYDLKRGVHKNPRLQAAWNTYGADMFVFEVIEEIPDGGNRLQIEDTYLMKCVGQPDCYNINPSAELPRLGLKHTEATKQKTSASRKGKAAGENHYRYGKQVTPEVREKIGKAQRGIKKGPRMFTPEGLEKARANMRINAREQTPLAFSDVLAKFPQEIQQRYDFSRAVYTGALIRITGVMCNTHGVFSQYAAQFRKGRGCPLCGADTRAGKKKEEMKRKWEDADQRAKMLAARGKKKIDTPPSP